MLQKSFVAIKPTAVKRGLIGRILQRFEDKQYKIVAMKIIIPTKEQGEQHYLEHKDKSFFTELVAYITSGPIVAMVVEGEEAIVGIRKLIGATDPLQADAGTVRADFAQYKRYNMIHASDCEASANREIAIYFNEEDFCDYEL